MERGKYLNMCKRNSDSAGLYAALSEYGNSDFYPYHMPGHKRNRQAGEMARYYDIDITEIDGFDDLHHAEGILRDAQERANRLYGAEETFYLVGGSTCGVLASIMATAERGAELLIARNCHKSVYHAAILQELRVHYCYPALIEEYGIYDGIAEEDIRRLLREYPDCRAVVITSPTYEGILSDIGAIARVVHEQDKILIVDEAHGAHLGLDEHMPEGAVAAGVDLVIHSLHKTLPAMTQTALLHVQGRRVNRDRLRRYLSMLQTSSPSYVMMASMDSCIRYVEAHGAKEFAQMRSRYDIFCKKIEECRHIEIGKMTDVSGKCQLKDKSEIQNIQDIKEMPDAAVGFDIAEIVQTSGKRQNKHNMAGWDIGKLVIFVRSPLWNGQKLYDVLRKEYHLQMEMAAGNYVVAIMTIMDTEEGWQRLADALLQIDGRIEKETVQSSAIMMKTHRTNDSGSGPTQAGQSIRGDGKCLATQISRINDNYPVVRMTAAQAFGRPQEEVPLEAAAGRVSADFINLYPPGIPLLVPGEVMSESLLAHIRESMRMGLRVQGVTQEGHVSVLA